MGINIEAGLAVVQQFVNNCSYSMYGSRYYTDGTCDCSGSVYRILRESGGFNYGYIPSTETLHDYLTKLGYEKIAENSDFPMQRGDVIIWGQRGYSAGAGGHTGVAVDNQNWIECTGWKDTTIISNHDQRWVMAGCPYFYAYRLKTSVPSAAPAPKTDAGGKIPIHTDGDRSKGHLDNFGISKKDNLLAKGWHCGNYPHQYIFLMDYQTGKELARIHTFPNKRSDVAKVFGNGYLASGFEANFNVSKLKGKKVYIMMRRTRDAKGDTAGGYSDIHYKDWYLTL